MAPESRDKKTQGNGGCRYLLTFIMKLELKKKKRKASSNTEQGFDKSLTWAPQGCTYLQKFHQDHFLKI